MCRPWKLWRSLTSTIGVTSLSGCARESVRRLNSLRASSNLGLSVKKFVFKFASLMKLRVNERDMRRQLLAEVMRRDDEFVQMRQRLEGERTSQIDDMRQRGSGGQIDVDGSASRRFYAGQLSMDMETVDRHRHLLAQQVAACRQAVIRADQGVKALENIEAKDRAEFEFEQERKTAIELEESWRALHAGDRQIC